MESAEAFDGLSLDEFFKAREYAIRTNLQKQNPQAKPAPQPSSEGEVIDPLSDDY